MSRAAKRPAVAAPKLDPRALKSFGTKLRAWYRRNARDLPWRKTRDPYAILVSELMLQQTQVSRVLDFWTRFLHRFPTLESLAAAKEKHVLEQWAGLGYYARARNLHKLSVKVVREGPRAWGDESADERGGQALQPHADSARRLQLLPSAPEDLRKLPGIGAYTAGAVATFAFEKRASLVDTNVARVLTRVFARKLHPKRARDQKAIWAIAEATLPRTGKDSWTHNQALMELGALVCTARVARCEICPVRSVCATYAAEAGVARPSRSSSRA
jgi:A/G-specific adenine glycosylase